MILIGITILKKYYDDLLTSLPKDHVITLHHFCKLMHISNDKITEIADLVASSSNSKESNRVILDAMILSLKNDYWLLGFSYALEKLVEGSKFAVIESLRVG